MSPDKEQDLRPVPRLANLSRLQAAKWRVGVGVEIGGRRYVPRVFTAHGALMVATILNSPRAVEISIYAVRAFVRLRELATTHRELAMRLDELEQKTEALAMNHDTFNRNTRNQLKQVFDALRELMTPPDPPKRPIGFVTPKDKGTKTSVKNKG